MALNDFKTVAADEFLKKYETWEKLVHDHYLAAVRDENYTNVTRHSLNLKGMLDALPKNTRDRLMAEYDRVIDFDQTLRSIGSEADELRWLKGLDTPRPLAQFRVPADQIKGNPLGTIYNRMFLNKNVDGTWTHGANILSSRHLRTLMDQSPIGIGKKVFVFDTETAGLLESSGVREVAGYMTETIAGPDGKVTLGSLTDSGKYQKHFKTARMEQGFIRTSDGNMPLNKALSHLFTDDGGIKYANEIAGEGDDFVNALRPLLKSLREADVIVGQNLEFDINQILGGLGRTAAYKDNVGGFAKILDETREALQGKQMRDTLEMLRSQLPDLALSDELSFAGKSTRHALENIMLQTNLPDLLADEVGGMENLLNKLGGGTETKTMMHAADVDAWIEGNLFKYLLADIDAAPGKGMLKELTSKEIEEQRLDSGRLAFRKHVLTSWAPTPISDIADAEQVVDEVFERMLLTEDDSIRVMDETGGARSIEDLRRQGASSLLEELRGPDAPPYELKINPLEQEIFETRDFSLSAKTPIEDDLVYSKSYWKDTAEGVMVNEDGTLSVKGRRLTGAELRGMQAGLDDMGIPFAKLSAPERWISTSVARAAGEESTAYKRLSPIEKKIAAISEDLGVGASWAEYTNPYVAKSNIASVPFEVLQAAEAAGEGDERIITSALGKGDEATEMLSFSPFMTEKGEKRTNLMYRLTDEDEVEKLASWIEGLDLQDDLPGRPADAPMTLGDLNFTKASQEKVAAAIRDTGKKRGIGIAVADRDAGARIHDTIISFQQGLPSDEVATQFRAGFFDRRDGVIRTGPVHMDRFRNAEDASAYTKGMKRIRDELLPMYENIAGDTKRFNAARMSRRTGGGEVVKKVMRTMDLFDNNRGRIAAGAGALVAGLYGLKKYRENKEISATFEQQAFEGQIDYNNYREELGLSAVPANRLEPLATAGVVGNLSNNKIGHMSMSSTRNSNLYGGAF